MHFWKCVPLHYKTVFQNHHFAYYQRFFLFLGKNQVLSSKKLLLLEGSKIKPRSISDKYSNRVVSINLGTHKLLNDIGAWSFIAKNRFSTVKRMQVTLIDIKKKIA